MTCARQEFITRTKEGYDKKMYPKLMLNILKIMGNFIYTSWACRSKKNLTSNLHVAHVHPCMNYELTTN
jgi:hypothetical protein